MEYTLVIAVEVAIASWVLLRMRKVRTAGERLARGVFQGPVLDNIKAEQSDGKCNRKETASRQSRACPELVEG